MAGANMSGGTEEQKKTVPSIGGPATIAADGHTDDGGAQAVSSYPETPGVGGPEGTGFPAGTVMTDKTPGDNVN